MGIEALRQLQKVASMVGGLKVSCLFSPTLPSLPQALQAPRSLFKMRFSLAALALPIAVASMCYINFRQAAECR